MTHQEFKTRFLPYYQKLYRLAFRYQGNECDAEDMVQNAYLKLWEKQEFLDGLDSDEAYAVTLLKHLCLDKLRSSTPPTDNESALVNEIEPAPPPDRAMEQREDMKRLLHLIADLPEPQRKVLLLRHFEEKSNAEIEQETGLSNANIRVLLSRARKTIKELFTPKI
ncbi:RNA polymerase sigma factor [Barnesiella viscericola]|uniref:RNA polymerase sigma factor n=1 Tax=Barnesiella viscericola TaxID=397865 RepID=UPI0024B70A0C|nr:sigma-70 family RNA polymerase sigma factor [Barnesiella viscericola]